MGTVSYEFQCYIYAALIGLAGVKRQKGIWLILFCVSCVLWQMPDQLGQIDFRGLYQLVLNPVIFAQVFSLFCAGACFYVFRDTIELRADWAIAAAVTTGILLFFSCPVSIGSGYSWSIRPILDGLCPYTVAR